MSRPSPYDLDELLAFWDSGNYRTAPELMEAIGIPREHLRSVQKAIHRYCGPRPRRAPYRPDPLRRRVIAWMVANGRDQRRCTVCDRFTIMPMYLRQSVQDDELASLVFVCRACKRGGDF